MLVANRRLRKGSEIQLLLKATDLKLMLDLNIT